MEISVFKDLNRIGVGLEEDTIEFVAAFSTKVISGPANWPSITSKISGENRFTLKGNSEGQLKLLVSENEKIIAETAFQPVFFCVNGIINIFVKAKICAQEFLGIQLVIQGKDIPVSDPESSHVSILIEPYSNQWQPPLILPIENSFQVYSSNWIFLEIYRELHGSIRKSTPYNTVVQSRLLRHLLIERLADNVNSKFRIKLTFPHAAPSDNGVRKGVEASLYTHHIFLEKNEIAMRLITKKEFLAAPALTVRDMQFSILDTLKLVANSLGGYHHDLASKKTERGALYDAFKIIEIDGINSAITNVVQQISQSVLIAFHPLYNDIQELLLKDEYTKNSSMNL